MFSYYFDPTYVLVIIAFLLTLFASMGVKSTFSKYNDVRSSRGITGQVRQDKFLMQTDFRI